MKKILCTLVLFLAFLTAQAYDVAINGIYYNIDSSTETAVVTFRTSLYNSYSGSVIIPSTISYEGVSYKVTNIGDYAFCNCSRLTSITIPDNVTSIGKSAFYNCPGLTSVTIPDNVINIGEVAFGSCKGLTSVTIPDNVINIGEAAFSGCKGLASVTIGNNVSSLGEGAFEYCSALTTITIPNNVTHIGRKAFRDCKGLTSVSIGNGVESINYATFANCTSLNSVTIGNNVTTIGEHAFENCTSLTSVIFGNSVTSLGYSSFQNCSNLFSIDLPNSLTIIESNVFRNTGLISITIPNSVVEIGDYVWASCKNFISITLGNNVTKIGKSAFMNCKNLNSLDIPDRVESIGNNILEGCSELTSINIGSGLNDISCTTFSGCPKLGSIIIDSNNPYYDSRNNCNAIIETSSNTVILGCKNTVIPNNVTTIGEKAFSKCTILTSIIIPNSVTTIGNYAFGGCSGLTSIIIPNSVTTIRDYAFDGCSGLTSIHIPNSVTSIGNGAFSGCSGLTSITISEGVGNIGDYAFSGCSNLKSIYIPKSITNIGEEAFSGCNGLESVNISDIAAWCNINFKCYYYESYYYYKEYSNPLNLCGKLYLNGELLENLVIPEGVTTINSLCFINCTSLKSVKFHESMTSIGNAAFYNCTNLTSINMHQNVTNIGAYAFYNCASLKSITIPNNVTSIGERAFNGCSSLTSIDIPNSVETIGTGTFSGCSGLTSVSIGNGVKFIGEYTFARCSNLTKVYITDIEKWCNISFDDYNDNDYSYLFTSNPLTVAGNLYLNGVLVTDLVIPDGVKRINQAAFSNCTCLKSVTIPSSVKEFGWVPFNGVGKAYEPCILYAPSDYHFNVDTDVPSFKWNGGIFCLPGHKGESGFIKDGLAYTIIDRNLENRTGTMTVQAADKSIVGDIVIPVTVNYNNISYDIIGINKSGFKDCTNITSIIIPKNCNQIEEGTFMGCTNLKKVTIDNNSLLSKKYTSSSSIKNIFDEQVNEYIIGENVTSIGSYVFNGCTKMTSITLPKSVTNIGWGAFQNCKQLKSVNIPNSVKILSDCLFKNCSSLTSVELPDGITSIESSAFYSCASLLSITIPNSVEKIGSSAFGECSGLKKVTIDNNFLLSKKYTSSSSLKNIFGGQVNEYVIGENVTSIGDYAFYKCNQMTSVIIPSSMESIGNYAFGGCNQIGDVYSHILFPPTIAKNTFTDETYSNAILHVIKQAIPLYESTEFWNKFTNIINFEDADIGSVTVKVIGEHDTDLTKQVSILWYDDKGSQIASGSYLGGVDKDSKLFYSVILDESLGCTYKEIIKKPLLIKEGHQDIECLLSPIPHIIIRGNIWFNARPLPKAEVKVHQWMNGKYEKSYETKTDAQGFFSINAQNDSTLIKVSAEDCLDKTVTFSNIDQDGDIGDIFMNPVLGKILMFNINYLPATKNGVTTDIRPWMDDLNNLDFSIYNASQQKKLEDIHQYNGDLILPRDVNNGDILEVTATSRTGQFAVASSRTTMNENDSAQVSLILKELGGLEVLYLAKNDDLLMAILFDSNGNMYTSSYLSTQWVSFDKLEAGDYTLVTMGYYNNVGIVASINDLDAMGLTANEDYDIQKVCIQDGVISELTVSEVPELDLSKFGFTTDNTSYLPNKTSMSINQFFTMTARVDFQQQYIDGIDDAEIIIQLPKDSYLIDNSVLIDNKLSQYSIDGNKLHIPISREQFDKRVRFCIQPMNAGVLNTMANVRFNYKGERTSSVGYASMTCTSDQIHVPTKTNQKEILVSGMAPAKATVDVYDNVMLIGSTTAKGDGSWKLMAPLYEPYNLTTHSIYANITKDNNTVKTITRKCKYDKNAVHAKTVEMSFFNDYLKDVVKVIFDLENGTTSKKSYSFYKETDFTFVADLSINDTIRVKSVEFLLKMTGGYWMSLDGFFDEKLQKWAATGHFSSNNLPVNVVLNIDYDDIIEGDRQYLDDLVANVIQSSEEQKQFVEQIDSIYADDSDKTGEILQQIVNLLSDENADMNQFEDLNSQLYFDDLPDISSLDMDSFNKEVEQCISEYEQIKASLSKDSIYSILNINPNIDELEFSQALFDYTFNDDNKNYTYQKEIVNDIDDQMLTEMGYFKLRMDDKSYIYTLLSDSTQIYIDTKNKTKYTLKIDNADNVNNVNSYPSKIQSANVIDIIQIVDLLKQVKKLLSFMNNPEVFIQWKIVEKNFKLLFAIQVKDKYGLQRMIKELDNTLSGYDYLYGILHSSAESILSKSTTIINSLNVKLIDIERIERSLLAECELARINYWNNLSSPSWSSFFHKEIYRLYGEWLIINKLKTEYSRTIIIIERAVVKIRGFFYKLPSSPPRLSKGLAISGKIMGGFGVFLEIIDLYNNLADAREDFRNWKELLDVIDTKIPCPKNPTKATNLKQRITSDAIRLVNNYRRICVAQEVAIAIDIATFTKPNWLSYIASGFFNGYAEVLKVCFFKPTFMNLQFKYIRDIQNLKCKKDDDDNDDEDDDEDDEDDEEKNPPTPPVTPVIDPSGYVYEAVPSNRVENVTATIYHDEDSPTFWDAEDFSQINPIITDKTGVYAWDVPQGMWKVKFDKYGYEPKQTDWLPVPPPQLEVNIPIDHAVNPHVTKVYGTESGISLTFDKYMKPDLLSLKGKVSVTRNGEDAKGEIQMLNLEEDPLSQKEYASYVKFVPNNAFDISDDVVITVKKEVESYASMPLLEDFVQRVAINPDMKIISDSLVVVDYKDSKTVTLAVQPAAAAKGKTLMVESVSPMVASADKEWVTLDDNGETVINVAGNLPGTTALKISMPNTYLTSMVIVNVVIHENIVRTPKASKRTGSVVEEGYRLSLSTATKGATIYYTTDGSCPCEETSRIVYAEPITINSDITIKAMAVREGMEDSDIATFSYTVTGTGTEEISSPADIDVTYENGKIVINGAHGAVCRIYDTIGRHLTTKHINGDNDRVNIPYANTYIVSVEVMGKRTFVRKITRYHHIDR